MRRFYGLLLLPAAALLVLRLPAQQPTGEASATPCILQNGTQHCSEPGVKQAITAAKSIAIESGPRDHVGDHQLRAFVTSLGKSLALNTQSADVALRLSPVEQAGVNYGAADRDLARLDVYAPVGPANRQQLIWVETLSGPADLSWPAAAARLLEQFKHRVMTR